jgi:lipopolysaccharide/colanic/teichoic acid biosynthesis glycosyltransferase
MDLLIAAILLVAFAPLLLIFALATLLDSGFPVLYRQQRLGQHGRVFTLLKLRTMRRDAEPRVHQEYVRAYIQGRASPNAHAGRQIFKLVADQRITRFGRWLRRTSLDELPQLWNVLRGDMSLVGPRPPIPYELEWYQPGHYARLAAPPGITGLWQVNGRHSTTFEEMVRIDVDYIRRASLLLDLVILLRTARVIVIEHSA